jgi:putative ABC transport system permease protein
METLLQDLRYGIRALAKSPALTVVAILTMAIGIGANAAIFSFVNGLLLRPLPFPEPDRLITLSETNPEQNRKLAGVSPRNLEDWEKQSQTVAVFGAWRDWRFHIQTPDGLPDLVPSAIASPGLFDALGVKPVVGRSFSADENQRGRDHVVLLSHRYWQSEFGGDPKAVGQSLVLDNEAFTIIGVLPDKLESLGLGRWKIWAPLSVDPDQFLERHHRNRRVIARLKPGVTLNQAQAEMDVIAEQLAAQYPKEDAGWGIIIRRLQEVEVGDTRAALLIFAGAVGLVLLIACANVANLLLARAAMRRKEMAIRAALGAGRFRIIRQLLTESFVLAMAGGAVGVVLAFWLIDLFIAISPGRLPRVGEIKLDGAVLAFTFLVSLVTGVLFGLAPGLQGSRVHLVEDLKEGGRDSGSRIGFGLRSVLVVSQVTLAMVLLVGAGLLGRTFIKLTTMQPGYNPDHLLTVQLFLPFEEYKKPQVVAFYQRMTEEFKAIPGVEGVGATSAGPEFGGIEPVEFIAEGQTAPATGDYPHARYYNVGPDYFHTMQTPVLQGREFTDADQAGAPAVAMINETLARRFFAGENPVGKRLMLPREKSAMQIVGVVGDVQRLDVGATVEPEIYWPYMQQARWATYFAIRVSSDPASIISAVRQRVAAAAPQVIVANVETMDQLVSYSLKPPRFNLLLLGIFAVTALFLASVGLYGVISYSVMQRTREIGVRMALGAPPGKIFGMVIGQGMMLTLVGIVVGAGAALAATRLLAGMLFGVSATDPLTIMGIALLLAAVALVACYLPARRAIRVDPIIALRTE